ncbi:MAG: glycosyltransferase family 2 protein [Oceanospirillaceae bacterium]
MNELNFTVIIPLYNKEGHILRALESVQCQKYAAAQIIVIDDGSTDAGAALVKAANIENLQLVQQANAGVSNARNRGIALAKYKYIAFLDADDQWLPLYLEETARLIKKFPQAGVFGTRYQIVEEDKAGGERYVDAKIHIDDIDPTGVILTDYFDIASRGDLPFTMSSVTFRKSLFDNIDAFPEGERLGEDQDVFCRAALRSSIAYSNNIHSLYHRDAQNRACLLNIPHQECPFSIRLTKQALQMPHRKDTQISMLRCSAAHLCHIAKINIKVGRFQQARSLLADPRCKLKLKHLCVLYSLSWVKQFTGLFFGLRHS